MKFRPTNNRLDTAAFTMVEIAICLAIIGFALVAIIGVLPIGMNTQRDNREETSSTRTRPFCSKPSATARTARTI